MSMLEEYETQNAPALGVPLPDWRPPARPDPDQALVGRSVTLEPLDAERHAAPLFDAYGGVESVWTYMPYGPFTSAAEYHRWVRGTEADPAVQFYAVRLAQGGSYVGALSFLRIKPDAGSIELGHISFAPQAQRSLPATEALYLPMNWAFEAGYRRFEWKCNALNLPSRRAAQRLGFSYEGVFRQALVVKGRNRDTAWFSVIDSEWPALKGVFDTWLDPANFDAHGRQYRRLSDLTKPLMACADPVL